MLDHVLRLTFRDLSTYVLIVAAVILPLELAHAALFADVIAVRELHPEVERLPEGIELLGVTADRLEMARWSGRGLNVLQVALLPWLAAATRRALADSEAGRVPTVARALRPRRGDPVRRMPSPGRASAGRGGILLGAGAIGLGIGLMLLHLGNLVIEPFRGPGDWALTALVATVARAGGAPFFLVAWAASTRRPGEGEGGKTPNPY